MIMKKITALSIAAASYLSAYSPALATGSFTLDICETEGARDIGRFAELCDGDTAGVGGVISAIIKILFIVAVLLALLFLIYGGIKWILSGGDKGKVEAARGTIVAALVGLVLVFLSYFLLMLVLSFFGLGTDTEFTIPSVGI
jgi:hypothetical protein